MSRKVQTINNKHRKQKSQLPFCPKYSELFISAYVGSRMFICQNTLLSSVFFPPRQLSSFSLKMYLCFFFFHRMLCCVLQVTLADLVALCLFLQLTFSDSPSIQSPTKKNRYNYIMLYFFIINIAVVRTNLILRKPIIKHDGFRFCCEKWT